MLEQLIRDTIQKAVEKFLPDISNRLNEADKKINEAFKELVNAFVIIGKFSDKYNAIQEETNNTLRVQQAINQRLFNRTQDILTALKEKNIEVKDEDTTMH
jgi:mannitol-1-phosphate/altronate dehydrogenase